MPDSRSPSDGCSISSDGLERSGSSRSVRPSASRCGCSSAAGSNRVHPIRLKPDPTLKGMFKASALAVSFVIAASAGGPVQQARLPFHLEEATIAHLQQAIVAGQITTVGL